jgi:VCBS repeat-containing protein
MATPVANDDLTYAVLEDAVLRVTPGTGVLVNDTDADNDALAARTVTVPLNPLFDFKTNGSFVYDARYHGELWLSGNTLTADDGGAADLPNGFDSLAVGAVIYDTFTYAASDGQTTDTATVRIAITGVNDNPLAWDDSALFDQGSDSSISIAVLANDTDVDVWPAPDVLSVVALSDIADEPGPAGGSDNDAGDGLSIVTKEGGIVTLVAGELVYQAADGFFGIDTFEYTVSDGNGGTDTGLVRITVLPTNLTPDAVDDSYSVDEDASTVSLASVLGNDTDTDDAPLIAAELVDPIVSALRRVDEFGNPVAGATGLLVDFNSDGTFNYDPNGEFESLGVGDVAYVAFDYIAYDGHGASDQATVTIEITGANDNPTGFAPGVVTVYEAGLADGSGDGTTTTVQLIDIAIDDTDASDTPFVAGTTGGSLATLVGLYGTLEFVDNDTVRYTLTDNADHEAIQGHNGGIFDDFTVYVVDEHGGFSAGLTVSVEVIDDINFLVTLPNAGGTGNDVDSTTVAYAVNATTTDDFTLIAGADGQALDVVGIPDEFTLIDGRTVTSTVYLDANGHEAVRGTDSDGDTFYEITFDPDAGTDLGSYTLTMFQEPPIVVNDLDFSALGAGGPQEYPVVENIGFNGGFFTDTTAPIGIFASFADPMLTTQADDINPNNAGGIGIGNGNIERLEALVIDVTGSVGNVTGMEFDVQGVGGGIGQGDLLWEAVENGVLVASGSITVDLTSTTGAHTLRVEPGTDFDFLYVALDPLDFDSNDKMRINRIATLEQVQADDIVLGFRINSDDGDGDQSPLPTDVPNYEEFTVTVLGTAGGSIDPGIIGV